jgi:pyruvate dehydrogenase E1 component alpha subunit
MIFVVEDNGYAESTASAWSVAGSQVGRGEGFGMPSRQVDGHDFLRSTSVGEMIERARAGGGPSLLHVKLQRFYGHFEGDAQTYRVPGEAERARTSFDPLNIFRQRVTETALLDAATSTRSIGRSARISRGPW